MRNVTLRVNVKGTAVVLEEVFLRDKKLFNTYAEAVAYVATLNIEEAFGRNRTRNVRKEDPQSKSTEGQSS